MPVSFSMAAEPQGMGIRGIPETEPVPGLCEGQKELHPLSRGMGDQLNAEALYFRHSVRTILRTIRMNSCSSFRKSGVWK